MNSKGLLISLLLVVGLLTGCAATTSSHKKDAPPVNLVKASEELPEEQLLDVWIELFDPGELPEKEKEALGLSMDIREAEARYMPMQLRGVMEKTGYWGAVRVVPYDTEGADVLVRGLIVSSDGAELVLKITAEDASGKIWFRKSYSGEVDPQIYDVLPESIDSFQALYRLIANDLVAYRNDLSDQERISIRQFADLRFAADMAPDAFAGHLNQTDKGMFEMNHLPAENDPAFQRVQIVRERDFLLIDTLNGHFDNYYLEMSGPYLEWRKARSIESAALREVKKKANTRKALGVAAILGAIAIEVLGGPSTQASTGTLRDVMVLGGAVAIKQGMDINAQSPIHQAAIEELGMSFSSEAKPMTVNVDGEVYKLTGSAEVQYQQWRTLMREIYASETGLGTIDTSVDS
jgi:hypothetical protein